MTLLLFLPFVTFASFFFFIIFFLPCFFPRQAIQAIFQVDEITKFYHRQMKEEEGRRNAAVEAFNVAEKRINNLKNKLTKVEQDKKSSEAALDSAKRQAKGQRVLLHQAEDQLATSKGQIIVLKNKLEGAEKVREQAEQDGYDVGVVETEEALEAKVSWICRNYCLRV